MLGAVCGEIGVLTDLNLQTMGGHYFWNTEKEINGWRIQTHNFLNLARILDEEDVCRALGNKKYVFRVFDRMTKVESLKPGDVVGISGMGLYEHYAVYTGHDEVIHYAAQDGDFSGQISVHRAPFHEFLRDSNKFFVLHFPEKYQKPYKIPAQVQGCISTIKGIRTAFKELQYQVYSPEETVKRAKSRLGETSYNLALNNCEHFAIWCKTGISESHQVNEVLKIITPVWMKILLA